MWTQKVVEYSVVAIMTVIGYLYITVELMWAKLHHSPFLLLPHLSSLNGCVELHDHQFIDCLIYYLTVATALAFHHQLTMRCSGAGLQCL